MLFSCDGGSSSTTPVPSSAHAPATASAAPPSTIAPRVATPPAAVVDSNPFHLPPRKLSLDPGRRVFTVSDQMLAGARVGSTLVLYAANVAGLDGDDVIVEGRGGPSYKVHAGYVIPVPDDARVRPNDMVLTEWAGTMKHAFVIKLVKDKIVVRFTDMDARTPETSLKNATRFVRQVEGLVPGNYAALKGDDGWSHVLLVSPFTDGDTKRWFALGFGGAALLCDEVNLKPIPIKYTPKNGAAVSAEWAGKMRSATVTGSEAPGLFNVKYDRAGRPATLGFGLIMPALEPPPPASSAPASP